MLTIIKQKGRKFAELYIVIASKRSASDNCKSKVVSGAGGLNRKQVGIHIIRFFLLFRGTL